MFYKLIANIWHTIYKTSEKRIKFYSNRLIREFNAIRIKPTEEHNDILRIYTHYYIDYIHVEIDGSSDYGMRIVYDIKVPAEMRSNPNIKIKQPEIVMAKDT